MIKQQLTVAASILTANFLSLKTTLLQLQQANVKWIHFDVMDYHFVNNLSFGPKILHDICEFNADINIDCHMMVTVANISIKQYLQPFILPQVKNITFHYEALTSKQITEFLQWKNPGFNKGLAINPDTDITNIYDFLPHLDMILIMSVYPGAGGQKFIPATLAKIKALKAYANTHFPHLIIGVDGGINNLTARDCRKNGANYLVAGSYLINNGSIAQQLAKLMTSND